MRSYLLIVLNFSSFSTGSFRIWQQYVRNASNSLCEVNYNCYYLITDLNNSLSIKFNPTVALNINDMANKKRNIPKVKIYNWKCLICIFEIKKFNTVYPKQYLYSTYF